LLLDGVNYFQVVFTLPSELSSLALGNRGKIYDLLFASAWSALKETIQSEQGYDPAALMVLHTWSQQLEAHAHAHAVVPGGGPALDGSGWVNSRKGKTHHGENPDASSQHDRAAGESGFYLVDAVALRRCYRDHFLAGLTRLRERAELNLQGDFAYLQADQAWQSFVLKLASTEWVSYIQPPPRQAAGQACCAEHVLKYLGRYLTGGPISDGRIIAADEDEVTFLARAGKTPGGDKHCVPITLSTIEFLRRWCLHILPKGYTKTRQFGGWHNRRRHEYLERCAIMLEAFDDPLPGDALKFHAFPDPSAAEQDAVPSEPTCPSCGRELRLIDRREKPSWSDVMDSPIHRPTWYTYLPETTANLASPSEHRLESAKGRHVAQATKFNARSIPLHPTPG
jgi:hypothetical protein